MWPGIRPATGWIAYFTSTPRPPSASAGAKSAAARPVREIGAEDAAVLLSNIRSLIIVPGYGMAVAQAQHVIIVKRSLNAGFAGIDNPLYYDPKTLMFFADAKGAMTKLHEALKQVA